MCGPEPAEAVKESDSFLGIGTSIFLAHPFFSYSSHPVSSSFAMLERLHSHLVSADQQRCK